MRSSSVREILKLGKEHQIIMKVFVTGGTGLVGSNVIKVAREKYDAEVVASMYTRVPAVSVDYTIERLDITDAAAVRSALKKHAPDLVIHCAATVDIALLEQDHVLGWRLMADARRKIGGRDVGSSR